MKQTTQHPAVTVEIRSDSTEFDNVDPIDLEVEIRCLHHGLNIPPVSSGGSIEFEVKKLEHGIETSAEYVIRNMHALSEGDTKKSFVSMFIPQERDIRRANAQRAIENALQYGKSSGVIGKHFADGLISRMDWLINDLSERALENDVGQFEIVAIYSSTRGDAYTWSGVVRSNPLRIRVEFVGSSFEKLPFDS